MNKTTHERMQVPPPIIRKTLLFTFLLLTMGVLSSFAQELASINKEKSPLQEEQINKKVAKPLGVVLGELESKYKVNFSFNVNLVKDKFVSNNLEDKELEKTLSGMLTPLGLQYKKIENNYYVIQPLNSKLNKLERKSSYKEEGANVPEGEVSRESFNISRMNSLYKLLESKDIEVRGRVTSQEDNSSLPGVNVFVKGTTVGTTTDADGRYAIRVPDANSTLVFSFIGFTTEEVPLNGRSTVDIVMLPDVQQLSEVVVIGYGTVKRSDLTGSVASVTRKDVGNIAVQNVGQMIQGRVPGVNVVSNNGLPGSGVKIKIRGTGTIYNSDPLYIINGMPGDINSVSPYDIETMQVLKDASATAIYGARAANGVVLVTTKKGQKGEPTVTYNGYYGVATRSNKLDLLEAGDYMDLVTDIISNTGRSSYTLPGKLQDPSYTRVNRTDWQDAVFRRAALTEHHVNFSGGTDFVTYSLSTGYTNMDATGGDYSYDRFNVMANSEFKIGKRIKIGENFAIRMDKNQGNAPDFTATLRMPPYAPATDPYNLGGFSKVTSAEDLNDAYNPLTSIYTQDRERKETKILAQIYADVELAKFLNFRSQFIYENWSWRDFDFREANRNGNLTNPSRLIEEYRVGQSPKLENYITFNKEFGIHSVTAMVGNTIERGYTERGTKVEASNFGSYEVLLPTFGADKSITGATARAGAYLSYYGRLNYSLLNKYLVTLTYRTDGSPKFAPTNRFGTFPSAAIAWKLHEESFMADVPYVSTLKLRLSWGKSGNDRIDEYQYLSNIYTGDNNNILYPIGTDDHQAPGATINSLPAPNIRWEESTSSNIGIDLGLFQNKLNFTAEYYDRLTDGILVRVPIPLSLGIDKAPFKNAASVRNKGVDLSLAYNNEIGTDFQYSISAVAGFYNNKVESLGEGNPIPFASLEGLGNTTLTDVGHPIGAFYGFKVDHVLRDDADAQQYRDTYGESVKDAVAGDIAFKDLNDDKKIDTKDKTYIGDPNPDFTYGINLGANYKNFDFQAAFMGVQGNDILNLIGTYWLEGMRRPFNASTETLNRWRTQGQVTDIPRATQDDKNNNLRISDRYIEDGSYLRLRNVTLGYRVPFQTGVYKNLRVYFTAENLLTLTKYSGFDPEITATDPNNSTNYNLTQGIDNGQFPQPRRFLVGVQITF